MNGQSFYEESDAQEILRLAAQSSTGKMTHDQLVQAAAELGISPEAVADAEARHLAAKHEKEALENDQRLREIYRRERRSEVFSRLLSIIGPLAFMGLILWFAFSHGGELWWLIFIGPWGFFRKTSRAFAFEPFEEGYQRWRASTPGSHQVAITEPPRDRSDHFESDDREARRARRANRASYRASAIAALSPEDRFRIHVRTLFGSPDSAKSKHPDERL